MVSFGVSRMKKTSVVIVEPCAKVNSKYYCEQFLRRGFMPLIQATCGRHNWTFHSVRTELSQSYTARNSINFLLQENVTFFKLDKWQPTSSNLKSVDYAIWVALHEKVSPQRNYHSGAAQVGNNR